MLIPETKLYVAQMPSAIVFPIFLKNTKYFLFTLSNSFLWRLHSLFLNYIFLYMAVYTQSVFFL